MELGLSTHLFVYQPLDEKLLELIRGLGFVKIELWGMRPHFDYERPDRVKQLAQAAANLGIDIHSVHAPFYTHVNELQQGHTLSLAAADPNVREEALVHTRKALNIMDILGAKLLVVHAGDLRDDFSEAKSTNLSRSLEYLSPLLQDCGVNLALENIATALSTTANLSALVEPFDPDWLGICLDIGHAQLNEDVGQAILNCGSRIMGVHISDNDGVADLHYLPGEGIIDWHKMINILQKVCYSGIMNLELRQYADQTSVLEKIRQGMKSHFSLNI